MSGRLPYPYIVRDDNTVPDEDIVALLGQGLGYDDWKQNMIAKGHGWNKDLKFRLIKSEFEFFREEIEHLKSEENKSRGCGPKTNSLESILKRLKGDVWCKGIPDEREDRLRRGRLLGRDAKPRCLQGHAKKWANEAASQSSSATSSSRSQRLTKPSPDNCAPNSVPPKGYTTDNARQASIKPGTFGPMRDSGYSDHILSQHNSSGRQERDTLSQSYADASQSTTSIPPPAIPDNQNPGGFSFPQMSHMRTNAASSSQDNNASTTDINSLLSGFHKMPSWSPELGPTDDFPVPYDNIESFPVRVVASYAPNEPGLSADFLPFPIDNCNWGGGWNPSIYLHEEFHATMNNGHNAKASRTSRLSQGTQTYAQPDPFSSSSYNQPTPFPLNEFSHFSGHETYHASDAHMADFPASPSLSSDEPSPSLEQPSRYSSGRRNNINELKMRNSRRLKDVLRICKMELQNAKQELEEEKEKRKSAEGTVGELLEYIDSLQTALKLAIPTQFEDVDGETNLRDPFPPPPHLNTRPSPTSPHRRFSFAKALPLRTVTTNSGNSVSPTSPTPSKGEGAGPIGRLVRNISDKCLRGKAYGERSDGRGYLPPHNEALEEFEAGISDSVRRGKGKEKEGPGTYSMGWE